MKSVYFLIAVVVFSVNLSADEWKFTTDASLSLNQNAYSDNWFGGEMGSISWTAKTNSSAEKQMLDFLHNKNSLKLSFGQTHQQAVNASGEKYWAKPDISVDKIDFESLFKFTLGTFVDPFVSGRWESRFIDNITSTDTRTINPHLFTESAGAARVFINQEYQKLESRLGGALRQHYDRYDSDFTTDGGIESVTEYTKIFSERGINFKSRLNLYQALYNSESDDLLKDDWKALDIYWENSLNMKIWSVISMSLTYDLKYDKQEDKSAQYKQTLGLGIFYQLY